MGLSLLRSRFVVLGIVTLITGVPATAVAASSSAPFHVRSTTPELATAVREGRERSPRFRAIAERLDSSNLIMHLECGTLVAGRGGQLLFVTHSGGFRYLRVQLDCALPRPALIAMLAHELQHAVEVAEATAVVDAASMRSYYEHDGLDGEPGDNTFDSVAAIAAGVQVLEQLLTDRQAFATP